MQNVEYEAANIAGQAPSATSADWNARMARIDALTLHSEGNLLSCRQSDYAFISFIHTCARQAQQAQPGTYRGNQLSPTISVMC